MQFKSCAEIVDFNWIADFIRQYEGRGGSNSTEVQINLFKANFAKRFDKFFQDQVDQYMVSKVKKLQ